MNYRSLNGNFPPEAVGVGLVLEQASVGVYSKVICSFHSPFPMGVLLSAISVLQSGAINPHLESLTTCESNCVCVCVHIVIEINVLGRGQC